MNPHLYPRRYELDGAIYVFLDRYRWTSSGNGRHKLIMDEADMIGRGGKLFGEPASCAACLFSHRHMSGGFICRKSPPSHAESGNSYSCFPVVNGSDWCGEFIAKEIA